MLAKMSVRRSLSLVPALLAPASLLFPWAVVPGHLGLGLAGARYFVHWLTKYPSLGPINWQVGAGIVCVLGCAWLPVVFAAYVLRARAPSTVRVTALAVACVAVYVPVLLRLDLGLWTLASGWDRGGCALRAVALLAVLGVGAAVGQFPPPRAPDNPET